MKLMVGLGNPGKQYELNRHNVGFMVVDRLIGELTTSPHLEKKFESLVFYHHESGTLLVRPQTFMNKSGEAVKRVVHFYKVVLGQLYVIHDDLDIGLGQYKIQKGKGPKQHNGLQSIYAALGTKDFWHVRVGIENRGTRGTKGTEGRAGRRDKWMSGEEYVLQPFHDDEKQTIGRTIEAVVGDLYRSLRLL